MIIRKFFSFFILIFSIITYAQNSNPNAVDLFYSTKINTSINLDLIAVDLNFDDNITYTIVSNPSNGTISYFKYCIFDKSFHLKKLIIIILFITACSSSEKKQNDITVEQIPISINSFFDSKPNVTKLDSTLFNSIEKWSQIISFSEKFSDLIEKEINHKSKIKSLTVDIKKINKDNMPIDFKTSPIIGRLRVLKTFMQKIDSYLLNQENLEEYKSDIVNLLESYNALIYQINLRAKENLEN